MDTPQDVHEPSPAPQGQSADVCPTAAQFYVAPACTRCGRDFEQAATLKTYDRYYILACPCGAIYMWPRKVKRGDRR